MRCEDCGFEYDGEQACPRCGYDSATDLLSCITPEKPQLSNPLEEELGALGKRVEAGEVPKSRIQEQWRIIDNKAREGNVDARHLMGRAALMQQRHDVALKALTRLANAGHVLAQLDLARMHEEGLGVEPNAHEAVRLYRMASKCGHPIALFKLAEMHGRPDGILRHDPVLANEIMSRLVTAYPHLFQRRQGCGGCQGGQVPTNGEFALQTAFQMSKMIKYLILAAIVAFVAYVVFTEFIR